jgi:pimeloyl-ACP methyl ester carboxylesterase
MIDYLTWRGDVPLGAVPFNEVDNLILSEFSYLALEHALPEGREMTVKELGAELEGRPEAFFYIERENNRLMLKLMAEGDRFSEARICLYRHETDEQREKQFAAVTFSLSDGTAFVAYRGTDNTIVGWKEDFNLSFTCPVPAQVDALAYLLEAAKKHPGPLRVGGHSKGGNLAVYAAAHAPDHVQDRIIHVYSNDGPGMDEATFSSPGYARIETRLRSIVPQSSVIGILLQHPEDYTVVKSSGFGIFQHNPFSWQVLRTGFEVIEELRPGSRHLDKVLNTWLQSMSNEERMTLVDTMFTALSATRASTVESLGDGILKNAAVMLNTVRGMDPATRKRVRHMVGGLLSAAVQRGTPR